MPFIFNELPSTQSELKNKVLSGEVAAHLDYVLTHHQTDGKGRQGRPWLSGRGNLYLSFFIAHHQLPLTWIPHWIASGLMDALIEFGAPAPVLAIKWPNDILVNGTDKIAGILCEKVKEGVVVGVGVNLISSPEVSDQTTSSLLTLNQALDPKNLNVKFADHLLKSFFFEPDLHALKDHYQKVSLLQLQQTVSWKDLQLGTQGAGVFLRYGTFGELIASVNGVEKSLFSEEIQLVKKP